MQGTGWRAIAVAALGLLGIAGAEAKEIRIGLANGQSADYAPTFAAEKLGYFKAAGLDVKLIAFRGGAPAQEALTAGAADIITYFGPAVVLAISKGTKEKMVGTIAAGSYGWSMIVPADSPVKSVKDLDGKSVGISSKATTSDMAALFVAEKAGIKLNQIPVGAAALIPSLRSKQVDAIIFSGLVTTREVLSGRARNVYEIGDTMPPTMADVFVASQDMMDNRGPELKATLAAVYKALAYMKDNKSWAIPFLKEFSGSESDELTNALFDNIIPHLSTDGHIEEAWVANGLKLAARAWEAPELATMDVKPLYTNDFLAASR